MPKLMRLHVYEGTPEEIQRVVPHLPTSETRIVVAEPAVHAEAEVLPSSTPEGQDRFVSTSVARSVLTRISLAPEQRAVLVAIYKAHPARATAPDLQILLNYTTSQFAGLMGALGRRLSHTPGFKEGTKLFDREWNYQEGYNEYGMPDAVRTALELERMV